MEPDFRKDVTIAMDKNCLEHVGQHVFDLVSVLLILFASEKSDESLLLLCLPLPSGMIECLSKLFKMGLKY